MKAIDQRAKCIYTRIYIKHTQDDMLYWVPQAVWHRVYIWQYIQCRCIYSIGALLPRSIGQQIACGGVRCGAHPCLLWRDFASLGAMHPIKCVTSPSVALAK